MAYIGPLGFLTKSLSNTDTLKPYERFKGNKQNHNEVAGRFIIVTF